MTVLLALVAATSFAGAAVAAKRGMQGTNAVTALLVSSGVAAIILAVVVAFDPPDKVTLSALTLFVVAGLAGDGIGRLSMLGGVDRLGPTIAIPIQTAAYPLLAVMGGVVILAETVAIAQVVGVLTVVGGIWILLVSRTSSVTLDGSAGSASRARQYSFLALPVIAGVGFAASDLFRKLGLDQIANPAFGAFVAVTSMLTLLAVAVAAVPRLRRQIRLGSAWRWLVGAGVCTAVALLTLFKALEGGAVSVVGPIVAAQPLAVVVLSWLLLHSIERVTPRMAVGAAVVVGGVILIAVGV